MKVKLIALATTEKGYLTEGCAIFEKRLKHYCSFTKIEIQEPKNLAKLGAEQRKKEEATLFIAKLESNDKVYLLDEFGKTLTSENFASFIEQQQIASVKSIVFLIGGPFGFCNSLHEKADGKISLSKMTFSHQMIRLFFLEQLYRAYTIIKREKYHNP